MRKKTFEDLHKIGYLEEIGPDLEELKVTVPKNEIRFLGKILRQPGIIPSFLALHCLHKKTRKLPPQEIRTAKNRLADYKLAPKSKLWILMNISTKE